MIVEKDVKPLTSYDGVWMFYIDSYGQNFKKKMSEIRKLRLLLFGMQLYLVYLYQDCSNYSPMVENGPARRKPFKIFMSDLEGLGLGYLAYNFI